MSRIAFIFPGQGAQVCGMGQDFYEQTETGKKIFDKASGLLGFSMPELCFEKNDRLDITEYTQAAMVTAGIAMMRVLEEKGIKPDVAAGLSLGEYCALAAAGVMSDEDAICTVRQRGILMQEAVLWEKEPWQPSWPWTQRPLKLSRGPWKACGLPITTARGRL